MLTVQIIYNSQDIALVVPSLDTFVLHCHWWWPWWWWSAFTLQARKRGLAGFRRRSPDAFATLKCPPGVYICPPGGYLQHRFSSLCISAVPTLSLSYLGKIESYLHQFKSALSCKVPQYILCNIRLPGQVGRWGSILYNGGQARVLATNKAPFPSDKRRLPGNNLLFASQCMNLTVSFPNPLAFLSG